MSKKRKGRGLNAGTVSIVFIVLVFVAVMSIQIYKLKEKDALLADREQNLQEQLENESQRGEEIEELNLYTQTIEYIKEIAYKLGIISENEIIFKENDE
ncbi:MAG: septum formation initiator family protein [Lachnospiraceae bacterium]|nr:septum formation initiator family protein [Lachnospiraceae bacterium]MBO5097832.1 septum formation initiator family protein [Agathobacter sp.]